MELNNNVTGPQYAFVALSVVPLLAIFGNSLVVIAILTNKSLQTTTNILLLSLATADFMIGLSVMPFSVYLMINNMRWQLPHAICSFYIVADVACSTSSICHLVAISVDRFYAVVRHLEYRTPAHQRRTFIIIVFSWSFSVSLALPLGIGLNPRHDGQTVCGISNPSFMLYGSLASFYLPCAVMLIMYGVVFSRLEKQMKLVKAQEQAAVQRLQWGQNLTRIINDAGKKDDCDPLTASTRLTALALPFSVSHQDNLDDEQHRSLGDSDNLSEFSSDISDCAQAVFFDNCDPGRAQVLPKKSRITTVKNKAKGVMFKLKSKQGKSVRKETRATKLVACVMVVFLLCWLPFFIMNIIGAVVLFHDDRMITEFREARSRNVSVDMRSLQPNGTMWSDHLDHVFTITTWLGYINSCVNPVIYSLINKRFRMAFARLLFIKVPNQQPLRARNHLISRDRAATILNLSDRKPIQYAKRSIATLMPDRRKFSTASNVVRPSMRRRSTTTSRRKKQPNIALLSPVGPINAHQSSERACYDNHHHVHQSPERGCYDNHHMYFELPLAEPSPTDDYL